MSSQNRNMSETMKAAVLHGMNELRLDVVDKPIVGADTILLKIRSCSICGSDVRVLKSGNSLG